MSMNRRQALGASLAGLGAWAFSRPANAGDKKRYVQWCQPACYPPAASQPFAVAPTVNACDNLVCPVWEWSNWGNGFSSYYAVVCHTFASQNLNGASGLPVGNPCQENSSGQCGNCFPRFRIDNGVPDYSIGATAIQTNVRHPKIPHDKDPDHVHSKKVFDIAGPKAKEFDFIKIPHKTFTDVFVPVRLGLFTVRTKGGGPDPGTAKPEHIKRIGYFAVGQEVSGLPSDPPSVGRDEVAYVSANRVFVTLGSVRFEVTTDTPLM